MRSLHLWVGVAHVYRAALWCQLSTPIMNQFLIQDNEERREQMVEEHAEKVEGSVPKQLPEEDIPWTDLQPVGNHGDGMVC